MFFVQDEALASGDGGTTVKVERIPKERHRNITYSILYLRPSILSIYVVQLYILHILLYNI